MQMPVVDNGSSNTLDDIMYKTNSYPKNNFGFVFCTSILVFHQGKKSSTTKQKMVTLAQNRKVSITSKQVENKKIQE